MMERAEATWRIEEYAGRAGLARLEGDWRRLYAEMPAKTIFHSYDALCAHVDNLLPVPEALRCLALSDGQRIRAICLLEPRTKGRIGLRLHVWRAPRLLHAQVAEVLCGEDEARKRLLPALVNHLRGARRRLAVLHLGPLPADSVLWEGLGRYGYFGHCVDDRAEMHIVDCSRGFELTESGLSQKTRTNLRKAREKLERLPGVRFAKVTSPDELAAACEAFLDLEASGWKKAGGLAIKSHREWSAFYRQLARLRSAGDRCEINTLHADSRCIAAEFCLRTGNEYTALKIAYDEAYSAVAPGLLLVHQTLKDCCEDPGIMRLNWVSDSAWERRWHPDAVRLRDAYIALGLFSGPPLMALLHLWIGPGRRAARRLRRLRARVAALAAARLTVVRAPGKFLGAARSSAP
jgi:hypothetical protein